MSECVCVCVCVREREREKEKERQLRTTVIVEIRRPRKGWVVKGRRDACTCR